MIILIWCFVRVRGVVVEGFLLLWLKGGLHSSGGLTRFGFRR